MNAGLRGKRPEQSPLWAGLENRVDLYIGRSIARGTITAPPSKSMAHRHIICAALAEGSSIVRNVDLSQDISATLDCIGALGAEAVIDGTSVGSKVPAFAMIFQTIRLPLTAGRAEARCGFLWRSRCLPENRRVFLAARRFCHVRSECMRIYSESTE